MKLVKENPDFKVIRSDKTSRWCIVSNEVWREAVEEATRGDVEETDMKKVREWQQEDQLVAHAIAEALGIDDGWPEKKRHKLNCTPGDVPRARLMVKDHKPTLGFRSIIGYGTSDGSLDGVVASALAITVDDKRISEASTEIDSTEALIDALETFNQTMSEGEEIDNETFIILLDVVSLYPSLVASDAIEVMNEVKDEFSKVGRPCIASTEAILKLLAAANIDPQVQASGIMDSISEELSAIIPTRRSRRGRPPGYGSNLSCWNHRMLELPLHLQYEAAALAIAIGCIRSFRSHVALDNRIFRREGKGAIGSKSCGEIAASVMRSVDVKLIERVNYALSELIREQGGDPIRLYKRYVDDITVVTRLRKGVSKEEIEQKIREAVRLEEKPHLAFTSNVIRQGENGVVLDMRLQVNQDGRVERRFYRKAFRNGEGIWTREEWRVNIA